MTNVKKHLALLGMEVQDCITKRKGIVTSIGFDLYGCIQAIVDPGLDKEGKSIDSIWFDIGRLKILSERPVMKVPNFDYGLISEGKKGPASKPLM